MAPMNTSHDMGNPDHDVLCNMNPPSPPDSNEDIIPLPPSTISPPTADASDSSSSTPPSPTHKPTPSRSRAKKARKAAHHTQPSKPSLRPARDILSRIRHDSSLNEADFVVGYIDRHVPEMMEMDASAWKGGVADVTDEEWIPQHRIMYFRKKGDEEGEKVWDRATRLDRLFGSGVAVASDEGRPKGEKTTEEDEADVGMEELRRGGNAHVTSEPLS